MLINPTGGLIVTETAMMDPPSSRRRRGRMACPTREKGERHNGTRPEKTPGKIGEPAGTRTRDPKIKSLVLYQLSYGPTHTAGLPAVRGLNAMRPARSSRSARAAGLLTL